ncbi:MAG TPA: hypothetical protein VEX60_18550, partial [Pyrinomonadaceae bacterium]|nr:hypothetical protein [Pyrinomonadaceae bacterium]
MARLYVFQNPSRKVALFFVARLNNLFEQRYELWSVVLGKDGNSPLLFGSIVGFQNLRQCG